LRVPISSSVRGIEVLPPGRNPIAYLSDRRCDEKLSARFVVPAAVGRRMSFVAVVQPG